MWAWARRASSTRWRRRAWRWARRRRSARGSRAVRAPSGKGGTSTSCSAGSAATGPATPIPRRRTVGMWTTNPTASRSAPAGGRASATMATRSATRRTTARRSPGRPCIIFRWRKLEGIASISMFRTIGTRSVRCAQCTRCSRAARWRRWPWTRFCAWGSGTSLASSTLRPARC